MQVKATAFGDRFAATSPYGGGGHGSELSSSR
jgi:hypothetical protein